MNTLKNFFISALLVLLISISSFAQNDSTVLKKIIKKTDISGQWFLAYTYDITDSLNYFNLKRGYFTIKTDLNPSISVRYTQDITIDKEGTDAGNVEIRMKYLYMKVKPFKSGAFKNTFAEFGLVHRPWLDFEQKINDYRVQGKMYIEDIGIFNSADFGITIGGLIGGKLDKRIQEEIGSHYPGKYGSYSFGLYNGAGYHDNEFNNNKTFEGRLTVRPLPQFVPGFQLSYSTAIGKANIEEGSGDFNMHLFYLSYENQSLTFSGQYYTGTGDTYGRYYFGGEPYANSGYSVFGEFRIPQTSFGLVGRYDMFNSEQNPMYERSSYFTGVSYRFLKNKLLLYYNRDILPEANEEFLELVLEVAF